MSRAILNAIVLAFAVLMCNSTHAQQASAAVIYNSFDQAVGIQNTGLYRGMAHKVRYRTINENTQYFISPKFLNGTVKYAGQEYHGLNIKYDVYDDRVLIKLSPVAGGATLELFPQWIDHFTINGHRFVRMRPGNTKESEEYGFYEVGMEGREMTLYIKHSRNLLDRKDKKFIYYEFSTGKSVYILHFKKAYHIINSKKDIIALFPEYTDQIRTFFRDNRESRRDHPDTFYSSLIQYLDKAYTNAD